MHRWLQRIFHPSFRALYWSTRLYSVFFFALAAILLFGGARGLVAYAIGVRTAWSDPLASGAGLVAGILSVWTGIHVLRGNITVPGKLGVLPRLSKEMAARLDQAIQLQRSDPAVDRLVSDYFRQWTLTQEAERARLRQRAPHDLKATLRLRRELQADIANNAQVRAGVMAIAREPHRPSMLVDIDARESRLREELEQLDGTIKQLTLR